MITPIPKNYNTNQIKNNILGTTGTKLNQESEWIYKIKENFFRSLDYTQVYKNLDESILYDTWVFQGNKDDKILGSYKEFLSYPYDTLQFDIGDYISFDYGGDVHNWLITSLDKKLLYNVHGRIERCNIGLDWQDSTSGELLSYPAVVKERIQANSFDFNNNIILNDGYISLIVQNNDYTKMIPINKRFLMGEPYQAFKVRAIVNYTDTNTIQLDLMIDQISVNDNLTLGIADYISSISAPAIPTDTPW